MPFFTSRMKAFPSPRIRSCRTPERVRVHPEHRAGLGGGLAVRDLRGRAVHDDGMHAEPRRGARPRGLRPRGVVEEQRVGELVREERRLLSRAVQRGEALGDGEEGGELLRRGVVGQKEAPAAEALRGGEVDRGGRRHLEISNSDVSGYVAVSHETAPGAKRPAREGAQRMVMAHGHDVALGRRRREKARLLGGRGLGGREPQLGDAVPEEGRAVGRDERAPRRGLPSAPGRRASRPLPAARRSRGAARRRGTRRGTRRGGASRCTGRRPRDRRRRSCRSRCRRRPSSRSGAARTSRRPARASFSPVGTRRPPSTTRSR